MEELTGKTKQKHSVLWGVELANILTKNNIDFTIKKQDNLTIYTYYSTKLQKEITAVECYETGLDDFISIVNFYA